MSIKRDVTSVSDVLKSEYEAMHNEFMDIYGQEEGNCSCHISPPCGSCTHEGNILNLYENDDAWENALVHAVREIVEGNKDV